MPISASTYFSESRRGTAGQPCLVLIHGAASSHLVWPAALRRLPGWRVIAVDLPGHGRSPGMGCQSIAGYAAALVDFLAGLEIHRAVLAGHSMGGAIALQVALDHPTLAAGLGLISTGCYLGVSSAMLELLANPSTIPQALDLVRSRAFAPQTPPALVERCMAPLAAGRASVLAGDWQASAAFDVCQRLDHITCPAWVAVGAHDRMTPRSYSSLLSTRLPAARLQVIPAAGHMLVVENPTALTAGLQSFLKAQF